jgi:hypothetical protein
MTEMDAYLSIITMNINGLNSPIKRYTFGGGVIGVAVHAYKPTYF